MKPSRIFNWLERLSPDDLTGFETYCTLIHNGQLVGTFLQAYRQSYSEGLTNSEELKARIIELIWPGVEVKHTYWKKVCSKIVEMLRQYLAWQSWKEDPINISLHLTRYMNRHHWDEEFDSTFRRSEKLIESAPVVDSELLRRKTELHYEFAAYYYRNTRTPKAMPLKRVVEELDMGYIVERLKLVAGAKAHDLVFHVDHSLDDIPWLLQKARSNYGDLPLPGQLYYHAYLSMKPEQGENHYQLLKSLVFQETHRISPDDTWDLFTYMINFCARSIRKGDQFYHKELHTIFERLLATGGLLEKGKILPWLYKNIVVTTVRMGKIEWAQTFTDQYESRLTKDHASNAANFCRAMIAFSQEDFPGSRALINKVLSDYKDNYYGIDSRILYWKCNVELGESLFLDSQLHAFIKYFQRSKLLTRTAQAQYIKFFRLSVRYMNILERKERKMQKQLEDIRSSLSEEDGSEILSWLLAKVEMEIKRAGKK